MHTIPHERSEFKHFKVSIHRAPPTRSVGLTPQYIQVPPPFLLDEAAPGSSHTPPSEHLLVTASFGRILPNSLLNNFLPSRRVNVHPSLLPAYRGASPIQYALMNGERETGVCVIEMTERKKGIDSGAIWGYERMVSPSLFHVEFSLLTLRTQEIPHGAMFPTLRDSLAVAGGNLLVSTLRDMLAGRVSLPSAPHGLPILTPISHRTHAHPNQQTPTRPAHPS